MKITSYHRYFNEWVNAYVARFVIMETMRKHYFINENVPSLKNRRVLIDVAKVNFAGQELSPSSNTYNVYNNSDGG